HPIAYGPAADAAPAARDALPVLRVTAGPDGPVWWPRPDLLGPPADRREVVADIDDDGRARLRFDDDTPGQGPTGDDELTVLYRVGNGSAGNVGAGRITGAVGMVGPIDVVAGVCNPLPATGRADPEDVEAVRLLAPT